MATTVNRTDTFEQWRVKTNLIGAAAGDLNDLDVRIVSRGTIVAAVNELQGDIGTVQNLVTTEKTNLVGAVNEVKAALVSFATDNIAAGDGLTGSVVSGVVTLANSDKGSSQNIFKKIAVSGQSNVVADNNDDTLTLVSGSNIQITTNATTDSITITGTTPLANNSTVNVTAGGGLSGGGSFTVDQAAGSTITITNADRGTSQNIFKNIAVQNQSTVVADNNDDTLTFIAGQVDSTIGITISTDAANDTITFAHANTSSVGNVTATTRTYVTGITFDTYGHVQAVTTGAETYVANDGILSLAVSGTGLSGSTSFTANQAGNSTFTVSSNATASNTGGTIVARDGNGDFSARTLTLSGVINQLGASRYNTIGFDGTRNYSIGWTGGSDGFGFLGTYAKANDLNIEARNLVFNTSGGNNQLQLNSTGRTIIGVGGVDQGATLTVYGTLYATGATTFASNVGIGGSLGVQTTLIVTGATTLSGGVTGGLAVTGAITATGDITAGTSDDRLKTRFGNIPNALNKVLQLNGFYYTHNKTAQQLGLVNKGQRVGVSAQEVLKVLPEVIRDAPIDESYMTVDYAKIIPLLIEAIKGLNAKVESLEAQLKK
jgi:hypothetical protein